MYKKASQNRPGLRDGGETCSPRRSRLWLLPFVGLLLCLDAGRAQNDLGNPESPGDSLTEKRALRKDGAGSYEARLEEAVRSFDDSAIVNLLTEANAYFAGRPDDFEGQLLLAKCCLARADLRRFRRKTYDLERSEDKRLRNEQADLSDQGLVFAERAKQLRPDSSEAYRVAGELLIHHITGPIAGLRYGPKGKNYLDKACELGPDNLEAKRAFALMYLYNPPINGGDSNKAAEEFDEVVRLGGDDRACVLAARAYLKLDDKERAKVRLEGALRMNPNNLEAKELLDRLE